MTSDIKKLNDDFSYALYRSYVESVLDYNAAQEEAICKKNTLIKLKQDQAKKSLAYSKSLCTCAVYYGAAVTLLLLSVLSNDESIQTTTLIAWALSGILGLCELWQCYKLKVKKKEQDRWVEEIEDALSFCSTSVNAKAETCMNNLSSYMESKDSAEKKDAITD
ncbi:hypothetical protein VCHA53O466_50044 [Vibrio chagasii]|nr:hypothetical protein VCHA53O466_50044 [Vibrio chagasii]